MAEPLNATFFAFRKREKSGVLLRAGFVFAIALLLLFVAFGVAVWLLLGPQFFDWYGQMMQMAQPGADPSAVPPPPANFGRLFLIFPLEMIWLFLTFVLLASFESACLRWMLRGETSAIGLHFGADMWRVYGTYWAWFLYAIFSSIGVIVLFVVAGFIGNAVSGQNAGISALVSGLLCLCILIAWLCVSVRLAPAAATSIAMGRFSPTSAWSVTRDRFWAVFGAFLLLTIIYFVGAIILGVIFFGAFYSAIFSSLDWSQMQSNPEQFAEQYNQAVLSSATGMFSNPSAIALYLGGQVVAWAFAVLFYILFYGVNARAAQAALEESKITAASA